MAANNSGAHYFILQARTIAEHPDVDSALLTEDTQITRCARAPYKGMKQTTSAGKVLKAKIQRHNDDLKKVQASLNDLSPTSKIGVQYHVIQPLIKGDSMPKSTTPSIKHCFESSLLTITEETPKPASSIIKLELSPTKSTTSHSTISQSISASHNFNTIKFRVPKHDFAKLKFRVPPPPSGIRLKFRVSQDTGLTLKFKVPLTRKSVLTEYSGVTKKIRFQITKLGDRYPRAFMEELIDRLINNHPAWETFDSMEIDNIYLKTPETLYADLKLNNYCYNSTQYPPPVLRKEKTSEEKERQKLDLAPERFKVKKNRDKKKNITFKQVTRSPKCDYFKALEAEKKKPTLAPSQLATIRQRHQDILDKGLALHEEKFPKKAIIPYFDRYNEKFPKKASTAYHNAEEIIDKRSKVTNLIRAKEGQQVKEEHVLSAVPLHMRFHKHDGIRGSGRIEYGMEITWCNPATVQFRQKVDVPRRWG